MSRVEQIEREIQQLSPEELRAFRDWFAEFDGLVWDRQFERDAEAGRLDQLADRGLGEIRRLKRGR